MPKIFKKLFDAHAFNFHKMGEYADILPIMVKIRDDLSGRVINNGLVDKPISEADQAKLDKGKAIAEEILKKAGAKKTYSTRVMSAHPAASIKLGQHLDANLRTKKFANLYVCDASVFPEPLGLPPSLSILGMGKRLAKHLAEHNSMGATSSSDTAKLEPAE
jgi:choline dehydrogenase-like flavoprotein